MNDIYCLKIEIDLPGQLELLDMLLGVEHNQDEPNTWVYSIDYDPVFGDIPVYYINNFLQILEGKYHDLERIGITREMISIWRCISSIEEVYMEYWPEEMRLMAAEGIKFRILCNVEPEHQPGMIMQEVFRC